LSAGVLFALPPIGCLSAGVLFALPPVGCLSAGVLFALSTDTQDAPDARGCLGGLRLAIPKLDYSPEIFGCRPSLRRTREALGSPSKG
jgi:hypothetical protein